VSECVWVCFVTRKIFWPCRTLKIKIVNRYLECMCQQCCRGQWLPEWSLYNMESRLVLFNHKHVLLIEFGFIKMLRSWKWSAYWQIYQNGPPESTALVVKNLLRLSRSETEDN
jgi:hypothetical protein